MAAPEKKISNYNGWLVKIGEYIIPTNRFVKAESFKSSAIMQDINDWIDANGYLHREVVALKTLKVEFETPAMLSDDDLAEFLANIDQNIINSVANECYVTAFVPRYNEYFTQKGYLADITPEIYTNANGELKYKPIRFAFVGGVFDG